MDEPQKNTPMNAEQIIHEAVSTQTESEIGLVVIGRNEGVRLASTLGALQDIKLPVIYVDSRSVDDSVEIARSLGVETLVLSADEPVNASRARNSGAKLLLERSPGLPYLQFLDGDTELDADWLRVAINHMNSHPEVGFVCGQLREKDREQNVYRRLCDMEWRWEATDNAEPCRLGGMGVMRCNAYLDSGGYDETLIAGADPELYGRLVKEGWRLNVLDVMMGLHDSGMTSFRQWWTRCMKTGFGFANQQATGAWKRELRSAVLWGGILPLFTVSLAMSASLWFLIGFGLFPFNVARIWMSPVKKGFKQSDRLLYSASCMLMKIPQFFGAVKFYWRKTTKQSSLVIQYK